MKAMCMVDTPGSGIAGVWSLYPVLLSGYITLLPRGKKLFHSEDLFCVYLGEYADENTCTYARGLYVKLS